MMSSTTPVTCLFCQHINPAGDSFCSSCASQLNLQPCLHCGAVDNRTAPHCYKCGTPLPLHQMPEPDAEAESGALDTAQTASALGHALVGPAKEVLLRRDLTPGTSLLERLHERNGSDVVKVDTVSRSGWLLPGITLLLVMLGVFAFTYSRQSGKNIQTENSKPLFQAESKVSAASAMASHGNAAVTPADTPRASADTEVVTYQVPLPRNGCAPAVATLGLCDPEAVKEKP